MIDEIMRKLGYINEKKLIDVAVHVYESNDEAKAKNQNGFYYCCGNVNAINYIMYRFGINFSEIIKERRKKHDGKNV
jgi:hypothetical protein